MSVRAATCALVAVAVAACTTSSSPPSAPRESAPNVASSAPPADAGTERLATPTADAGVAPETAPRLALADVAAVLDPDRGAAAARGSRCRDGDDDARVRCLLGDRFADDAAASALARELWTTFGTAAGVEVAHTMNGGYRGAIRIVPALPVGRDRKHLAWVVAAMRDFDAFFTWLGSPPGASSYRFRALSFRFMRSVAKRTPTAYARDWTIAYNLEGSLLVSEDAARETLFHEVFHLNDEGRGWWSRRELAGIYDEVFRRCGHDAKCLAPYAPTETKVRGGTYYAFHEDNGVVEYAAELALRYYREQRAVMRDEKLSGRAFKCGPPPNARAWARMRDAFFGGVDRTPPCPSG